MFNHYPPKLGKYNFQSVIQLGQSYAQKAVYSNISNNQQVFVKLYKSRKKAENEYNNQLQIYKLLQEAGHSVVIPKPIEIVTQNNITGLVMEYIDNMQSLIDDPAETKIANYLKVATTLYKVSPPSGLKKVTIIYQMISMPYFIVNSIFFYPQSAVIIFRGLLKIIQRWPLWLALAPTTVSHGDLNIVNILKFKDKTVLLDFTHLCISHKFWNMAQMLNSSWRDQNFQSGLRDRFCEIFKLSPSDKKLLESFELFNLLQHLCKHYENKKQGEFYISKLNNLVTNQ